MHNSILPHKLFDVQQNTRKNFFVVVPTGIIMFVTLNRVLVHIVFLNSIINSYHMASSKNKNNDCTNLTGIFE